MREAESIYHSACAAVQRKFHSGASTVHPHFPVVIGAERNELHSKRTQGGEIRMKNWDSIRVCTRRRGPSLYHLLTQDVIVQLTNRALRQADATVDVAGLK
jgi:hypothetical protein